MGYWLYVNRAVIKKLPQEKNFSPLLKITELGDEQGGPSPHRPLAAEEAGAR